MVTVCSNEGEFLETQAFEFQIIIIIIILFATPLKNIQNNRKKLMGRGDLQKTARLIAEATSVNFAAQCRQMFTLALSN